LWNGKVPWMLKVLHGTIDANKEPSECRGVLRSLLRRFKFDLT